MKRYFSRSLNKLLALSAHLYIESGLGNSQKASHPKILKIITNEMRLLPDIYSVSLLVAVISLHWTGVVQAAEFEIVFHNTGERVYCRDILMDKDDLRCSDGSASYLYKRSEVKSITRGGVPVYPYKYNRRVDLEDIRPENCEIIYDTINGPMLLEKDKYSYYIVGKMLESGVCVARNIDLAKEYYLKSGVYGRKDYSRLINQMRVDIDEEFARTLQDDANRKRERQQEWEKKCQQECMIDHDVDNRYRYSKKCYADCMSYMDSD